MVIGFMDGQLPLLHGPAPSLGLDPAFGGEVFGEEPVLDGLSAEDAQAAGVAHGAGQALVHEGLPVVRVHLDVSQ